MKKAIICIVLLLAFLGCENNVPPEIGGGQTMVECSSDNDCQVGGCSGTICESKNKEPIMTTCEFKPEYECYKMIDCKCIENNCKWDITSEFNRCTEEKKTQVT